SVRVAQRQRAGGRRSDVVALDDVALRPLAHELDAAQVGGDHVARSPGGPADRVALGPVLEQNTLRVPAVALPGRVGADVVPLADVAVGPVDAHAGAPRGDHVAVGGARPADDVRVRAALDPDPVLVPDGQARGVEAEPAGADGAAVAVAEQ